MSKSFLSALPPPLKLLQVRLNPDHVALLTATTTSGPWPCPACRGLATRIHGRYRRQIADLPWQGRTVSLTVEGRRLRCPTSTCPRRTFAEPLAEVARPCARRSGRLADVQRCLGLALGGEAGSRMAQRLAIPTSPDTLIRLVCRAGIPSPPPPRVIGIDEGAWRKGRRYGTVIIDLERNRVVDLLPDREAESVAAWLKAHPGIEIVARDRAEVYGEGVRQGAPTAIHVADRWHLLRNLSTALQTIVGRHQPALRQAARETTTRLAESAILEKAKNAQPRAADVRQAARDAQYEDLKRLREAGASVSATARTLGLDRKTVRKWLKIGEPPRWTKRRAGSMLDREAAYLGARWAAGCRSIAVLRRELAARGCTVKRSTLAYWLKTRLEETGMPATIAASPAVIWKPPSPVRTAWMLQADRQDLDDTDARYLAKVLAAVPDLAGTVDLVKRLAAILRKASDEPLAAWLADAATSPLKGFAAGLAKDRAAVQAAIDLPWSTSPAEGQINRLKLVKRTMYGRGGFHLLRHRVMLAA